VVKSHTGFIPLAGSSCRCLYGHPCHVHHADLPIRLGVRDQQLEPEQQAACLLVEALLYGPGPVWFAVLVHISVLSMLDAVAAAL